MSSVSETGRVRRSGRTMFPILLALVIAVLSAVLYLELVALMVTYAG